MQVEDRLLVWRLNRGDATALSRVYETPEPAAAGSGPEDGLMCSEQFHLLSQALEQLPAEPREP